MNKISKRHIIAGLEKADNKIWVTTSARMSLRKENEKYKVMRNVVLNEYIATAFQYAKSEHKFKLRSGEIAHIRKAGSRYFVAVERTNGDLAIIAVQTGFKPKKK
jgi:hypothetical protein